jgi:hypothetical protein
MAHLNHIAEVSESENFGLPEELSKNSLFGKRLGNML